MVTVCLTCGVPGYTDLLIYCSMCQISAEHRYCLDRSPCFHGEVSWLCEQCKPRAPKVESVRRRSMRNLKSQFKRVKHTTKMLKVDKRYQITVTAPEVSSLKRPHHRITGSPDVHMENSVGPALKGESSVNWSPDSLFQKNVDDLSKSLEVQFVGKNSKKNRRRLILPVDDQLDDVEERCENTIAAPKVASRQKLHLHITRSPDVLDENPAGSPGTEESRIKKQPDNLLQKGVVDNLPKSLKFQLEGKCTKKQRRRLILPVDDQLDEDVQSDIVNERTLKARCENTGTDPKLALLQKPHNYITCNPDVHKENPSGSIVNGALSTEISPDNLLQKKVSLSKSFKMQFEVRNSKKRRRLTLTVDNQLKMDVQSNNVANERLLEARYENTSSAAKVASCQKSSHTCTPDVHKENRAGSTVNGESSTKSSPDSLLLKEVDDLSQPCRMQLEVKYSKKERRRLILQEDDQLDEHVQSDMVNMKPFQVKKPITMFGKHLNRSRRFFLPNQDQLDEKIHANCVGQDSIKATLLVEKPSSSIQMTSNLGSTCQLSNFSAQPIINHVWRGYFDVCNEELGPIRAHISSKACKKVWNIAEKLPAVLRMTKVSRLDSCPRSFTTSPPNDESIALYFFADARVEAVLDKLLVDVATMYLALKFVLDEAELLVFSSKILPEIYHKFQGKYYLWGLFRRRHASVCRKPADCCPNSSEFTEEEQLTRFFKHASEKEFDDIAEKCTSAEQQLTDKSKNFEEDEVDCHDENACNVDQVGNVTLLDPLVFWGKHVPLDDAIGESPSVEQIVTEWKKAQSTDNVKAYGQEHLGFALKDDDLGITGHQLDLFPTKGEDMALTSRLLGNKSLDLELGLSRDNDACFKPMSKNHSSSGYFLDGAIFL